ncbi:MAG: hypothetical protein PWR06_2330 [Thermoanaerobacteraceae bacterium]|jgi:hypothetical protein|nr:hypothetical protein [Thermoanaerobacteraceae bacterium]
MIYGIKPENFDQIVEELEKVRLPLADIGPQCEMLKYVPVSIANVLFAMLHLWRRKSISALQGLRRRKNLRLL